MGLDMYLAAHMYRSNYKHSDEQEREEYKTVVDALGLVEHASENSPSMTVEVNIGYWRKANAIHRWFVENVQEHEDDCGEYEVTVEQIQELRDTCERVLQVAQIDQGQPVQAGTTYTHNPGSTEPEISHQLIQGRACLNGRELADILPTQSGFFFGGTDYDEWYLQDVERTIEICDNALALAEKWPKSSGWQNHLVYRSSW